MPDQPIAPAAYICHARHYDKSVLELQMKQAADNLPDHHPLLPRYQAELLWQVSVEASPEARKQQSMSGGHALQIN